MLIVWGFYKALDILLEYEKSRWDKNVSSKKILKRH